ncbi:acetyl-CoA carboxylase biotin carboxyl carrier protein [Pseudarthrobacter sp. H3Y2-7]|uniref:acetyl-CoA carboxylase biotin carboxyl carrier protein n=1 Tax=Pseudarthrobacter naphthalenicus TaxID=3031328 RepID=UPI0023AF9AE9|nr:acetyl-CoA carboxylase biotin carboxyl carrier protein [Pseudarthrobacter sp. H3Y2-7]MDE8670865.1 acetyl-CoA carboxylase biotin carboxyl carrier protein [Pseudarthrobacter sp. H3Y2-7]
MSLNPPDIKELKAIVDWANLTPDVRELSLKFGDVELFISRDQQPSGSPSAPAPAPAPATQAPPSAPAVPAAPAVAVPAALAPAPDAPSSGTSELAADEVLIKAPMVGIFYASPKPGAPNFVSVGDSVTAESVLCIVEVMKLMSNIEAQVEGTVVRILVENEQAVEYGQPLMVIKRHG